MSLPLSSATGLSPGFGEVGEVHLGDETPADSSVVAVLQQHSFLSAVGLVALGPVSAHPQVELHELRPFRVQVPAHQLPQSSLTTTRMFICTYQEAHNTYDMQEVRYRLFVESYSCTYVSQPLFSNQYNGISIVWVSLYTKYRTTTLLNNWQKKLLFWGGYSSCCTLLKYRDDPDETTPQPMSGVTTSPPITSCQVASSASWDSKSESTLEDREVTGWQSVPEKPSSHLREKSEAEFLIFHLWFNVVAEHIYGPPCWVW